jgi:hypothetical protein
MAGKREASNVRFAPESSHSGARIYRDMSGCF